MTADNKFHFNTRAIHAGQKPDSKTGAVNTPIYTSTTYQQDSPGKHRGFEYSRTGNPTRENLEKNLASLENGTHARTFASGMASINTVLNLLQSGDHVVAGNDIYGGTHRLFTRVFTQYDLTFSFIDTTNLKKVEDAFKSETRLLWVETPTNPLLRINDIESLAEIAHLNDALCVVDNTFATPYLQRPLDMNADIVSHSLTKYLGGHSDVIGGALITNSEKLDKKLGFYQNSVGATPGPQECYLVLRGIKTLPLRMERHCENARKLSRWLQEHPQVSKVYYPGLKNHPGHKLAEKQMDDFGGMLSFELKAAKETTGKMCTATQIFTLAESLGGVESLIEQPAMMTHASVPRDKRLAAGLKDGLVRVSTGVEHIDDLKNDLQQAIDKAITD